MARTARTWKGARTPSALKRARQSLRRRTVNRRTRSEAKTLVQQASDIALGRSDGDGPAAVTAAISALDKAAEKGILHPNNAARRKSRLMAKVNEAHLLDDVEGATTAQKKRTAASKTAQRKKVAAAKASKAAAGKAADRPRTAAGKAKVAVTRASRESAAARRRAKESDGGRGLASRPPRRRPEDEHLEVLGDLDEAVLDAGGHEGHRARPDRRRLSPPR